MSTHPLRILVADLPAMDSRVRAILPGDDLAFVRSRAEAQSSLRRRPFDLAVLGLQFDEGEMFELLRLIRELWQDLPVACVRSPRHDGRSSALATRAYERTVLGMGAAVLVDLATLPLGRFGEDRARRTLYSCIGRRIMMTKTNAYTRTLRFACETLGGLEQLAARLAVQPKELRRWLAGEELPPYEVFIAALDVVAAGPFAGPPGRGHGRAAGAEGAEGAE